MSSKMSGTMWKQFFQRWAGNGLSLQGQIRQMLVSAILYVQGGAFFGLGVLMAGLALLPVLGRSSK